MTLTKVRSIIVILVSAATILACSAWIGSEATKKTQWEYSYKAIGSGTEGTARFQETLTQAGSEGWDLVAVDRQEQGGIVHLYFKRAR